MDKYPVLVSTINRANGEVGYIASPKLELIDSHYELLQTLSSNIGDLMVSAIATGIGGSQRKQESTLNITEIVATSSDQLWFHHFSSASRKNRHGQNLAAVKTNRSTQKRPMQQIVRKKYLAPNRFASR
jgi:hypothetical protein